MRLINVETLRLEEFFDAKRPKYAILSHTWGKAEVSLQEWEKWQDGDASTQDLIESKRGFQKIKEACEVTRKLGGQSGFDYRPRPTGYLWVDTNCIDKKSSAELSEAINSMFSWYEAASFCVVYLEDVGDDPNLVGFDKSRWFTRGWTLQELLAPEPAEKLLFYNGNWKPIGTRKSLNVALSRITGISTEVLLNWRKYRNCSIAQRMSWASRRRTTRVEDTAYCLLGLFDINMPLLYGEGEKAFMRLQEEIMKVSTDQSLFAWDATERFPDMDFGPNISVVAQHPSCFENCGNIVVANYGRSFSQEFTLNNVGLSMTLPLLRTSADQIFYAVLHCCRNGDSRTSICIPLTVVGMNRGSELMLARSFSIPEPALTVQRSRIPDRPEKICLPRMSGESLSWLWEGNTPSPQPGVIQLKVFPLDGPLRKWSVETSARGAEQFIISHFSPIEKRRDTTILGCLLTFRKDSSGGNVYASSSSSDSSYESSGNNKTKRGRNKKNKKTRLTFFLMWSEDFSWTNVISRQLPRKSKLSDPENWTRFMKESLSCASETSKNTAVCEGLAVEVDFPNVYSKSDPEPCVDWPIVLAVYVDEAPERRSHLDNGEPLRRAQTQGPKAQTAPKP